jgi:hypothetical protein
MEPEVLKTKRKPTGIAATGKAGPGRPKGSQTKITRDLKEAILKALELTGSDGTGEGGAVGYLMMIAVENPAVFGMLLGKVLPLTLQGTAPGGAIALQIDQKRADEYTDAELAKIMAG